MTPLFALTRGYSLILASASPRRQQLLSTFAMPFTIHDSGSCEPEPAAGEDPAVFAMRAASCKGKACLASLDSAQKQSTVIIAADTIVCHGHAILGKPSDEAHALSMLMELSGRSHVVRTAVYLGWSDSEKWREDIFCEQSEVLFGSWDKQVLKAYVSGGEPMDKAGAYAIQGEGAFLVDCIKGSWTNVVGLPISTLAKKLIFYNLANPVRSGGI